jgi:hypothetical protein
MTSAPPSGVSRPGAESLTQSEARFDATVWRDEVTAQRHERIFVALADQLRRASNKLEVIATFDFDEILLPKPAGNPAPLGLGIQRQESIPPHWPMPHAEWGRSCGNSALRLAGVPAEWSHRSSSRRAKGPTPGRRWR